MHGQCRVVRGERGEGEGRCGGRRCGVRRYGVRRYGVQRCGVQRCGVQRCGEQRCGGRRGDCQGASGNCAADRRFEKSCCQELRVAARAPRRKAPHSTPPRLTAPLSYVVPKTSPRNALPKERRQTERPPPSDLTGSALAVAKRLCLSQRAPGRLLSAARELAPTLLVRNFAANLLPACNSADFRRYGRMVCPGKSHPLHPSIT